MTPLFSLLTLSITLGWLGLAALSLVRYRNVTQARPSGAPADEIESPAVDIIVPAHNEEGHLVQTLTCLLSQDYPRFSITVVDDESTDGTAELVHKFRNLSGLNDPSLTLLAGKPRPEGWVGKTWALEQGLRATDSDWVWMVDADLWLHPQALTTAIRDAQSAHADFVSYLGMPQCQTFWQRTLGITVVSILSMLFPTRRVNNPELPDAMAHGAFILVRRKALEAVGGMESVRQEIVEDIQLAKRVKRGGFRILIRPASTLVQTHMYGSFWEIWRGLRKNAYAGMDYALHKYLTGSILTVSFAWVPFMAILMGLATALGATNATVPAFLWVGAGLLGWFCQLLVTIPAAVFLRLPLFWGLTLPVGLTTYVAITTASAWHYHRGRVLWKDRAFVSPRTSADQSP